MWPVIPDWQVRGCPAVRHNPASRKARTAVDTFLSKRTRPAMKAVRIALLLTLAALTGCATPEPPPQKSLAFPEPGTLPGAEKAGKWHALPRDGGAEYLQIRGSMEDVVSFYGFYADTAPNVKSFEDMENVFRSNPSIDTTSLERGQILGVPVLWFSKVAVETGSGPQQLASLYGVNPRRPDGVYTVRTRGAFLYQAGPEPRFVTIACSRTSGDGQLGSYYLSLFNLWLTSIIERSFL